MNLNRRSLLKLSAATVAAGTIGLPSFAQAIDDEGGGVDAIEGKFRMAVQMLTPAVHFRRISGDTVENGHGRLLFLPFDQT